MSGAGSDPLSGRRSSSSVPIEVSAITVILAVVLGLLAGAGAALYQHTRSSRYVSAGVLLIDQPSVVASIPDAGPLQKLQLLRLQYASVVKTETIAGPVARQLHVSLGQIEGELAAFVDPASFTIDVIASAPSPSQASQVAQAGTAQLITYVAKTQAHLGIPVQNRVVLSEVTTPRPGTRVVLSKSKFLVPAIIAFLVVAGGFLVVADLLRRRV
jgi:capsular polysaccharide biosynthesis protein